MRKYLHEQILDCMSNSFAVALLSHDLPGFKTLRDVYYGRIELVKSFQKSHFASKGSMSFMSYGMPQLTIVVAPSFAMIYIVQITWLPPTLKF